MGIHAIGDRAIDLVVDSYAEAIRRNPKHGLRHAIIHANIPTEHALDVMAALQREYDAGYPEPSATFTWWIGDTYAGNFGARSRRLNPFRTFQTKGHSLGERFRLQRHTVSGALRHLGCGDPATGVGHLRRRSVRPRRVRGCSDGAASGDDLGRAPDVPRNEDWLHRSRKVCRPRGLGPESVSGGDGRAKGNALRVDAVFREDRFSTG